MLRIITGKYGRRLIETPHSLDIRPTKDRVKESVFNKLFNLIDDYSRITVVDLFSGTGNLGIEAISRGAKKCYFVEMNFDHADLIQNNLNKLEISSGRSKIIKRNVLDLDLNRFESPLFFADPPYKMNKNKIKPLFDKFRKLKEGTIVVYESSRHGKVPDDMQDKIIDQKEYGYSQIIMLRI